MITGTFGESQWGIHVTKEGSAEDFLAVLYPRASGEKAPRVTALAGGAGARVAHGEGFDVLLVSPDRPAQVSDGGAELRGEMALARHNDSGALRLVVMARGPGGAKSSASLDGWGVESDGLVALEMARGAATGVSRGDAQTVVVTLPPRFGAATMLVDGHPATVTRDGQRLTMALPAGGHVLSIRRGGGAVRGR